MAVSYQINTDKILYSQVGEDGVIYDLIGNEYVSINETFYKILKGIEDGKTKSEIVAALCEEYTISEADCLTSVDKAIKQLEEKAFIITA